MLKMNCQNILYIAIILLLFGCSSTIEKAKNIGKRPEFNSISVASSNSQLYNQDLREQENEKQKIHRKKTNSLWQPGTTNFLSNNKSWRIGDIVKISVKIQDSAKLDNSTNQSRTGANNSKMNTILGNIPVLNPLYDNSDKSSHKGKGDISRKEDIRTEVAAIVQEVLPNGNLVIEGHQEVRVNYELREIKVAGIIRPKDISAENSVNSDQIAEARISYGGRGMITDVQQKKLGNQIIDLLPF